MRCERLEGKWIAQAGVLGLLQKNKRWELARVWDNKYDLPQTTLNKKLLWPRGSLPGHSAKDVSYVRFHHCKGPTRSLSFPLCSWGSWYSGKKVADPRMCSRVSEETCVFALLTTPELSFLIPFHAILLFFHSFYLSYKKWLIGRFLAKW